MDLILAYLKDNNIEFEEMSNCIGYTGYYYWFGITKKEYSEDEQKEIIKTIKNNCQA